MEMGVAYNVISGVTGSGYSLTELFKIQHIG